MYGENVDTINSVDRAVVDKGRKNIEIKDAIQSAKYSGN